MNIPLDRLYCYIENLAEQIRGDRVIIYRFWPHGSKNINHLNNLRNFDKETDLDEWCKKLINPSIWCNDQEPLDHEYYSKNLRLSDSPYSRPPKNLNHSRNIFEKSLLLHSEQRSQNVKQYEADGELIPVYYWSHAIIARDWFRYAEHEQFCTSSKKTFLIYNRAWSNTREYRLRFSDLLIDHDLLQVCQTNCNVIEPELQIHYKNYPFKNPYWKPKNNLEDFLNPTMAFSTSSADFDTDDYNSTDVEVVLETLFDDDRLHLTEKSLRPIACGQPFLLAGTQGSLAYLRSYGFRTFDTVWDETYDTITDPEQRLQAIVTVMQTITNWSDNERTDRLTQARKIADHNRQYFFSKQFFDRVVDELKTNLQSAFADLEQCNNYQFWIDRWTALLKDPAVVAGMENQLDCRQLPSQARVEFVMSVAGRRLEKKSKL